MSQDDQQSLGTGQIISRQYVQRLARVGAVVPAMYSIIESTVDNGDFDTFDTLGLASPDNAPGVSTTTGSLTGTYAYYVTFYDNDRGVEGDESAQSGSVSPSGQGVSLDLTQITNEASVPRATHFRIYRNLNGGSTYFFVAQVTVATTSYTDNNSDASISANDTLQLDNTPPSTDTYGLCLAHKGYMFLAGPYNPLGGTAYDDDFTWSKLNNPDAYPLVNRSKVERGLHGYIRAIGATGDSLLIFKSSAIYELRFQTDPSGTTGDGSARTMNTERGAINQRCVATDQGTLYVMDRRGIYAYRGGQQVIEMAMPLKGLWKRINWAQEQKFCAVVSEEAIYFFVALDGQSECHYAFVLDKTAIYAERGPRWFLHKYDHGIRDVVAIETHDETAATEFGFEFSPFAVFITEYGYTGALGVGYRDMVDPQLDAECIVVNTGSNTTTLVLTDPDGNAPVLSRTNEASSTSNVVGCYLHFPTEPDADRPTSSDWSQAYRITALSTTTSTNDTVTVTPSMPAAPPDGTAVVIGAIPDARYHSPVMGFGSALKGKRAGTVQLEYQPLGVTGALGVGVKLDRRGIEAITETDDESNYSSTNGGTFKQIEMGGEVDDSGGYGVANASVTTRGHRYMQLVFDGSGVDKPFTIDSVTIELIEMEPDG